MCMLVSIYGRVLALPTDLRVNPCIFAPLNLSYSCIVVGSLTHIHMYICVRVYR